MERNYKMSNPSTTVKAPKSGPGILIRILYYIFVGSWLGLIWTLIAWLLNLTIIGLPLGLAMINRIPQIMTLKPVRVNMTVEVKDGQTVVKETKIKQRPFLLRALYFLLIGFWFSLVWMLLAWLISTITLGLGLPLSIWMFDRAPALTTLAKN
jgi:uncharacterized membrane protein YccF (DUF307 family)